ncbi:MAG: hypothetical protein BIFFINMI_00943 [Phycisphaerae bacterium]|nr:hypothetical protein [Phycisphaerae bacterium]
MTTTAMEPRERVVELQEVFDGKVQRTFYCVQDPDFGHWMSREPFDGRIWTKDPACREEFASRTDAETELDEFLEWREEQSGTAT